jgi:hypothetical protein
LNRETLGSNDWQEEQRQRSQHPLKHLYSYVEIDEEGVAVEICRFLYDYRQFLNLYVSYPYVLAMDEDSTKQYVLEGSGKFKIMKHMNTFYELQMRVGKPTYFSPDFFHRVFID